MPTTAERIAALEEKLRQLKVRQQRIQAHERAAASKRERAVDTRRKILVGAVVLDQVARGQLKEAQLRPWIDGALVRDDDRRLFELLPRVTQTSARHDHCPDSSRP